MAIHYSIIIPTLNEEKFLPKLLTSLAAQKRRDFEVIVVDGRSKDKTVEKAKQFKKNFPHFTIVTADKRGVSRQRNIGAKAAQSDWLVFLDADSEALPYFLERIDTYINLMHPSLLTSWCRPDSEVPSEALFTLLINMLFESAIQVHHPVAPGPCTVVKRSVFDLVGGYDEKIKWGEDHDLTSRLSRQGIRLHMLRETLFVHSLRRFRNQGKLWFIQAYSKAILALLFTNKLPREMPGYILGGHLYNDRKKPIKRSTLKRLQTQLRKIMREVFE